MHRGIGHPEFDTPFYRSWIDSLSDGVKKLADEFPLGMRWVFPDLTAVVIAWDLNPDRVGMVREEELPAFRADHTADQLTFLAPRLREITVRRGVMHMPCEQHGQA